MLSVYQVRERRFTQYRIFLHNIGDTTGWPNDVVEVYWMLVMLTTRELDACRASEITVRSPGVHVKASFPLCRQLFRFENMSKLRQTPPDDGLL